VGQSPGTHARKGTGSWGGLLQGTAMDLESQLLRATNTGSQSSQFCTLLSLWGGGSKRGMRFSP